jgi:hypothetical protein
MNVLLLIGLKLKENEMKITENRIEVEIVDYTRLETGNVYRCVDDASGYYSGWYLYAMPHHTGNASKVFGFWLDQGAALFTEVTNRFNEFKFVKVDAEIVIHS